MRVLLDENLPVELAERFPAHDVKTTAQVGWLRYKNGRLLPEAEGQFDVLLTMDKGVFYQQDHRKRQLRIGLILAVNSRMGTLEPLLPHAERFISDPSTGMLAWISEKGIEPFAP